jgi:predicted transcriptional regulator
MKTVSERAKAFRDSKEKLKTIKAVAQFHSVSVATVSRYLALTEEELQGVDSGLKPIRERNKRTNKLSLPTNKNELMAMEYAAHCEFFTVTQATQKMNLSVSALRNVLETLEAKALIEKNTEYLPYVFTLTDRGCVVMDREKHKHYFSSSAIHQRLMRNQVELSIQKTNSTALFKSRTHCWDLGAFPSVGEHYMEFMTAGKKESALVIIDDYGIAPIRLQTALLRRHDKNKRYAKGNVVVTWPDVVDRYLVYTTSEQQKNNFENFYKFNSELFVMAPVIRFIPPIWK